MDQNIAQRKIKDLTNEVEAKVQQIGSVIQDLLFLLEMQEKADWSEIIQKFTVLSGMFSTLQQILRKSGIDLEDNIRLLKMTQLVPQTVSIDPDPKLQEWTEGRLSSFNHNIVPILLRTKLKPEVEEDEGNIERDRSATKQVDVVKHIKSINSLIDMLCGKLGDFTKLHVIDRREQISFSQDETMKLVRAVCLGKGIQPKATTSQSAGESSKNNPTNAYQGKATK